MKILHTHFYKTNMIISPHFVLHAPRAFAYGVPKRPSHMYIRICREKGDKILYAQFYRKNIIYLSHFVLHAPRTFAYGGKSGNMIYDPLVEPTEFKSEEEYRTKRTHTINHFYEKLLLLKDLMNTNTGKRLAKQRHQYMKDFLDQFYNEWEGRL